MKQAHPSGTEAIEAAMLGSMNTSPERKLEWACKQIEYLLNKVSYLQTHVHALEDKNDSQTGKSPHIETWSQEINGRKGIVSSQCVVNEKAYKEVIFYGGYGDLDLPDATGAVKQKLIDRLCREGVLTTKKCYDNPMGEERIV